MFDKQSIFKRSSLFILVLVLGTLLFPSHCSQGETPVPNTPVNNFPPNLLITKWSKSFELYGQPHAVWLDQYNFVGANKPILEDVLAKAQTQQKNPEIVVYAIPLRDLGQSSEGGFDNYEDYWEDNKINAKVIKDFVKKTKLTPRIYLEPDALSLSVQYRRDHNDDEESVRIYNDRITIFNKLIPLYKKAGAQVYLDGAHSGWFDYGDENISWMADALNAAGIKSADGLVTNTSNRQPVKEPYLKDKPQTEWRYVGRLRPKLDNPNLDIITDTSRNGGITQARQYFMAPNGMLIDNETPTGRLVGKWKTNEKGQIMFYPFFGKPRPLWKLLKKEKYTMNIRKSILKAPPWLDAVGDVQLGPAPTDNPPGSIRTRIHRYRYVKPPDDCDGSLNCPPGKSKSEIIAATKKKQPPKMQMSPNIWD